MKLQISAPVFALKETCGISIGPQFQSALSAAGIENTLDPFIHSDDAVVFGGSLTKHKLKVDS
jgi:hypothetical protein